MNHAVRSRFLAVRPRDCPILHCPQIRVGKQAPQLSGPLRPCSGDRLPLLRHHAVAMMEPRSLIRTDGVAFASACSSHVLRKQRRGRQIWHRTHCASRHRPSGIHLVWAALRPARLSRRHCFAVGSDVPLSIAMRFAALRLGQSRPCSTQVLRSAGRWCDGRWSWPSLWSCGGDGQKFRVW